MTQLTYASALDAQIEAARHMEAEKGNRLHDPSHRYAEAIRAADSYYASVDFIALSHQAMSSLPLDTPLEESDFLTPTGWMTLAEPFTGIHTDEDTGVQGGDTFPIVGVFWEIADGHALLLMDTIGDGIGGYVMHLGPLVDECFCYTDPLITYEHNFWEQWFKTVWLLLSQENVTEIAVEAQPRAARRRAERAHVSPTVRVIRLPRHARSAGDGTSDVEWQHRWIVSGHWRKQPWGPERSRIRPVWIAPYLKGPEDKPLKESAHRLFVASS